MNSVEVGLVMVMELRILEVIVLVMMVTVDLIAHAVEKIIVIITVTFKPMVRVVAMLILRE